MKKKKNSYGNFGNYDQNTKKELHYLKGENKAKMTIIQVLPEDLRTSVVEVANAITEIKESDYP